jgi:hypothetical protein
VILNTPSLARNARRRGMFPNRTTTPSLAQNARQWGMLLNHTTTTSLAQNARRRGMFPNHTTIPPSSLPHPSTENVNVAIFCVFGYPALFSPFRTRECHGFCHGFTWGTGQGTDFCTSQKPVFEIISCDTLIVLVYIFGSSISEEYNI